MHRVKNTFWSRYILLIFVFSCLFSSCSGPDLKLPEKNYAAYHNEALAFAKLHNLSTNLYILVDLDQHPGKNRMFVYDFKKRDYAASFPAMHGGGKDRNFKKAKYSNHIRSYLSARGKYELKHTPVFSPNYGEKLLLKGLEPSNSNARLRGIVVHPSRHAPSQEVFPKRIGVSRGCPAISWQAFGKLKRLTKNQKEDILFWIK